MGYTTEFEGHFTISPPLTPEEIEHYERCFYGDQRDEGGGVVWAPGYFCQWEIGNSGSELRWDGSEKFYKWEEWLEGIIKHFMEQRGHTLNGVMHWTGEDTSDIGTVEVIDSNVVLYEGVHKPYVSSCELVETDHPPALVEFEPESKTPHFLGALEMVDMLRDFATRLEVGFDELGQQLASETSKFMCEALISKWAEREFENMGAKNYLDYVVSGPDGQRASVCFTKHDGMSPSEVAVELAKHLRGVLNLCDVHDVDDGEDSSIYEAKEFLRTIGTKEVEDVEV